MDPGDDPLDDPATRAAQVTRLLHAAAEPRAAAELLPLVYDELRALARARMAAEQPGRTLQATALVHEAYLRLVGDADPGWDGRGHFFAAAAQAMRRILVEQARGRQRLKRGGDRGREALDDGALAVDATDDRVLAIDAAVRQLEAQDPRKAHIVLLRVFVGFTAEDTATCLGASLSTIEREWRFIKAWLKDTLACGDGAAPSET